MNLSLQKVREYKALSDETDAFSADLYRDNMRICQVSNDGKGGCHRYDLYPGVEHNQMQETQEYAKAKHPDSIEPLDWLINDLVDEWAAEKRLKRLCAKKTLFRLPTDKAGDWRAINAPYQPSVLEYIKGKYPDVEIEIANIRFLKGK